ncbi:MAG TPA: ATP-binding protein, partial [Gemmatimonadaceae bacterium]
GLHYSYKPAGKTVAVLADPEKMQQIVLNLLTNAVKFTESGGNIALTSEPNGNCIDIRVADTGPGISPEKLSKIFDPFVQAERRLNQPVQGVGLGLAISQDLARAMGGSVTVESVVGEGSTFTLSLPRAPRMNLADLAKLKLALTDPEPAEQLPDRALHEGAHAQRPKERRDENERQHHDA